MNAEIDLVDRVERDRRERTERTELTFLPRGVSRNAAVCAAWGDAESSRRAERLCLRSEREKGSSSFTEASGWVGLPDSRMLTSNGGKEPESAVGVAMALLATKAEVRYLEEDATLSLTLSRCK